MFRPIGGAAVWRGHIGWRGPIGVYFAMLVLCVTVAGWGALALFEQVVRGADRVLFAEQGSNQGATLGEGRSTLGEGRTAPDRATKADATNNSSGFLKLTQDWTDRILSNEFWNRRNAGAGYGGQSQPTSRSKLQGPAYRPESAFGRNSGRDEAARFHDGEVTTYRTVCVRLCDGYFWPISHATTEDYFGRDKATCERGCGGSPAKLYVYQNPGAEPEMMRDLEGQP